jgi:hypothetical protein
LLPGGRDVSHRLSHRPGCSKMGGPAARRLARSHRPARSPLCCAAAGRPGNGRYILHSAE